MPCFTPMQGWRSRELSKNGKRPVVFRKDLGWSDMKVTLPCGGCIHCRVAHSRHWAIRIVHEIRIMSEIGRPSCFITLTFNEEHCPADGSLDVKVFQDFMKRLRKRFVPKCPFPKGSPERKDWLLHNGIRFYHAGEYGSKLGRPHYHAILFGFDFPDKEFFRLRGGHKLYRSKILEELWPFGYSSVGSATFQSAAYAARYVTKKITGEAARVYYARDIDPETGELILLKPEYSTMSRNPGISKAWYDKYFTDVFPSDEVIMDGKKFPVPKFYDGLYELYDPKDYARVKARRKADAEKRQRLLEAPRDYPRRFEVIKHCKELKLGRLKRDLDVEDL